MKTDLPQFKISALLRQIGTSACTQKAKEIESSTSQMRNLHLRSLGLNSIAIAKIADLLKEKNKPFLQSISFSYNPIGNEGAFLLADSLPSTLHEIGLVGCDIGDTGGKALLSWMQHSENLKMACIEQNHFSDKLKLEFQKLAAKNNSLFLMV